MIVKDEKYNSERNVNDTKCNSIKIKDVDELKSIVENMRR